MRLIFIALMFTGCAIKTTPIYTTIKTPFINISDQGFLKEGFNYKKLIIYKAGNKPIEITLKNSFICLNGKCMSKKRFMKEFMPKEYPTNFFDMILDKKCIEGYVCKSSDDKIIFKDKKNKIFILIKELRE